MGIEREMDGDFPYFCTAQYLPASPEAMLIPRFNLYDCGPIS